MKLFRKYSVLFVVYSLILSHSPMVFADQLNTSSKNNDEFDLNTLALPSEVKNIGKSGGSIYYSPSIKGKILIPVNIWGEVRKSGLHFLPLDTTLVQGISLAGGPSNNANLEKVKLSRRDKFKILSESFDLREGGSDEAALKILKPGDTVFVEKSNYNEDRAYYTSLFGVVATILSSILLYREVQD